MVWDRDGARAVARVRRRQAAEVPSEPVVQRGRAGDGARRIAGRGEVLAGRRERRHSRRAQGRDPRGSVEELDGAPADLLVGALLRLQLQDPLLVRRHLLERPREARPERAPAKVEVGREA